LHTGVSKDGATLRRTAMMPPTPADRDLHERFKSLVADLLAHRRRHFPDRQPDDWVAECSASFEAFQQRFSTREEQQTVVDGFEKLQEVLRAPLDEVPLLGPPAQTPRPWKGAQASPTPSLRD